MASEVPVIQGGGWALEIVPIVVETIGKNPSKSREEKRALMRSRLLEKFVERKSGGWVTRTGMFLKTEDELYHNLDWTWLDQFAIPLCHNFKIIEYAGRNYRLTDYGDQLFAKLRDPSFEDTFRNIVINVDEEEWGILQALTQGPVDINKLRDTLQQKGVQVRKVAHLGKYLSFLHKIGLVKEEEQKPHLIYELNLERYEICKKLLRYRGYSKVRNSEFADKLHGVYLEMSKGSSSFVDIDALRPRVSKLVGWPESHFNKRLQEIPLRVGNYQFLFSQAAFPNRSVGVKRKGRYYSYLSIYKRNGADPKP